MKKSGKILLISIAAFVFAALAATIVLNIINPDGEHKRDKKKSSKSTPVENFSSQGVKYYKFDFPDYGHAKINFTYGAADKLSISNDADFDIIWEQKGDSIIFKTDTDNYFNPTLNFTVSYMPTGIKSVGAEMITLSRFNTPEMTIITDDDITLEQSSIDSLSVTFYNSYYVFNIKGKSKIGNLDIVSSSSVTIEDHQIGKASYNYKVVHKPDDSRSVSATVPTITFNGKRPELTLNTNSEKVAVAYNSPTVIPAEQ